MRTPGGVVSPTFFFSVENKRCQKSVKKKAVVTRGEHAHSLFLLGDPAMGDENSVRLLHSPAPAIAERLILACTSL